jgi:hypothetical protein
MFLVLVALKSSILTMAIINEEKYQTDFYWAFLITLVTSSAINLTQSLLFTFKRGALVALIVLVCEYAVMFPLVYYRTLNQFHAVSHHWTTEYDDKYLEQIWLIMCLSKIIQLVAEIVALKSIKN